MSQYKKTPTLDAAVFNEFDKKLEGSAALGLAKNAIIQMERKAANLHKLKNTVNPMQTPAQNLKQWHDRATAARHIVSKDLESFDDAIRRQLNGIELSIQDKAKLTPTPHAAEIRAKFSTLTDAEKQKALNSADPEILSAVVDCSPFLSGISTAQQNMAKEGYIRKVAPELVEQREAVQKLRDRFINAVTAFDGQIAELEAPEQLKQIELQAAEYQAALSEV